MRIVADTNILVSAIIRPNGRFARHIRLGKFLLLVSDALLDELVEVLSRPKLRTKYNLTPEYIYSFLQLLHSRSEHVDITESITVCRDEDDDKFLELAVSGGADVIVTYDTDLLSLHPFREIPIVKPVDFWSILEQQ